MRYFLIIIIFLFSGNSFAVQNKYLDDLTKKSKILFCYDKKICEKSEGRISYTQPSDSQIEKVIPSIRIFIKKYGVSFLNKNLKPIYLATDLRFDGNPVSGLSNGDWIWLDLDDYTTSSYYEEVLHHEFSSSIFRNLSSTQQNIWESTSILWYDTSNEYFLKCLLEFTKFGRLESEFIYEKGFLMNYSRTNRENDFNVYAQKMFSHPNKLLRISNNYNRIKEKAKKFKELYRKKGFEGLFPDELDKMSTSD